MSFQFIKGPLTVLMGIPITNLERHPERLNQGDTFLGDFASFELDITE